MSTDPVDVLFIGGTGRSGSTLLERYLSRHGGIFGAGELVHLWGKGFRTNQLCACGEKFSECPAWSPIRARFFDDETMDHLVHIEQQQWRVEHRWYPILGNWASDSEHHDHLEVLRRLYQVLQSETGASVVVDSSKLPQRGFVLAELDNVRLHVIHLVRDPRGVAYSWTKKKIRPEVDWTTEYLPQKSVVRSALTWDVKNLFVENLRHHVHQYRQLRYEDFVKHPDRTRDQLVKWLDLPAGALSSGAESHSVSGNPMRFQQDDIDFQLDESWKTQLSLGQKAVVSALTAPLLARYGYPFGWS